MRLSSKKKLNILGFCFLFASGAVLAQQTDIPLTNWTVPPYHSSSARGGLTTMGDVGDVTPGISFVGFSPCRLVDTRTATIPNFPAGYGPPALAGGAPRNFDLNSDPQCTGIPSGVEAYSLNVTVTNTQGPGFILIYPQGGAQPPVSTLNYLAGQTVANAAIVPAGTGGGVTVIAGVSGTDLIIDINGYFTDSLNAEVQFVQIGAVSGGGVIYGQNNSNITGSSGILGWGGNGSNTYGVEGRLFGSAGGGSAGVHGLSGTSPNITYGGEFENTNTTTESAGVIGDGDNTTGETYGVLGDNDSSTSCSAGVWGRSGANLACNLFVSNSGVLGTNTGLWGVLGTSTNASGRGVQGNRLNSTNTAILTAGVLGYTGTSGVHSFQDVTAGGARPFVAPYPGDAGKQIVFVATEADETLTMTRGRGRFQRGLARIALPEHFRLITEPEGLSIQVTPIGDMATVAVVSIDLDGGIVLKSSRSVEFFYTVHGVRRGYKDFQPVQDNVYFIPTSANAAIDPWPEYTKRVLIENKIYKTDGMPDLETAHRLGWDIQWQKDIQRQEAEQAADREADRLGVPEGSIRAQLPE